MDAATVATYGSKKLAVEVAALLRQPGPLSLAAAIAIVAERHPLRKTAVPRAWKKHGKWARYILRQGEGP